MTIVEIISCIVFSVLIAGFGLVVAFGMVSGRVNLLGLLTKDRVRASPERLLSVISVVIFSGYYLYEVAATPSLTLLPSVADELIYLIFGANGAYLLGKSRLSVYRILNPRTR